MSDIFTKKLNGFHLIDASAGTGKTYTITALVLRLLLEKGLTLPEILIVTYTDAAASDLRSRVRQTLVSMRQGYEGGQVDDTFISGMIARDDLNPQICLKRIQLALNEFDEAAIFTIHSFCQRTLKENGLESGMAFDIELEKDMAPYQHQVASDYWRKISASLSPRFLQYVGSTLQPSSLIHYFRQMRPELVIVPDAQEEVEFKAMEDRYATAYVRVAKMWQQYRDDIHEIFTNQTSLNGNKYRKTSVPTWLKLVEEYFCEVVSLPPAAPDCLARFAQSTLSAAVKQKCPPIEHPFFDLVETLWEDWQNLQDGYQGQLLYLRREFYHFAHVELNRVKEQEGILSFDDLLIRLQQGLAGSGGMQLASLLRNQYPAILIDEFQDTDPVQFKIFAMIHGEDTAHLLYLIGDPKQAIYNFRGADIFAYLKAASSVKNRESLDHNYRSEEGLIHGVNHLFSGVNPFLIDGIDFKPALFPDANKGELNVEGDDSANIHILFGTREPDAKAKKPKAMNVGDSRKSVATGCCAEITRLLILAKQGRATISDEPIQPKDIAILVRENKEARYLQRLLQDHGVASVVKDNENLFTASESLQLFHILKGVAMYREQRTLTTALATDCLGWSAMALHDLQNDDEGWDDIMTRFCHYHELWLERGFMAMFRALLSGENVSTRLLSNQGGERSLTNILHLGELLHKQAVKNPAVSSILAYLKFHLQGDSQDEEFEQRLESDSDRLQILTIHKSKGLQFPIVFCPFLWRGLRSQKNAILFHAGDEKQLTLDLGSPELKEHKWLASFEENAENLRLAYVALTRAKNRCVINWGGYGTFSTSPLGYLLHDQSGGVAEVTTVLKSCTDDDLRAVVQSVADLSADTIVVRNNPTTIEPFIDSQPAGNVGLKQAYFKADIDLRWQVTSFSKLTSGQHHESLITDRDQDDTSAEFLSQPRLKLFDFPRGANPGTFLHYLFEHLDFSDLTSDSSTLFIKEALVRFGYEEKWYPVMLAMLIDVCQVQLPEQDFCLAEVQPDERLNELEFHFPLAKVDSHDCANLFRAHNVVGGEPWYAMVEGYGFQMFKGFLKGFVDLVFMRDGRYFVVDWKSNYLGNYHGAYDHVAMTQSMLQSGYILQYHLYSLALHRYLGTRLDGYDYERHFGGVFYVYLRGVTKESNNTGLFWDRPTKELMQDLDALFSVTEKVNL